MIRITALALATAALMACNHHDHGAEPHEHGIQPQVETVGQTLKEFKVSESTIVRFHESEGIITVSLQGAVAESAANKALEDKLMGAANMEAAYRVMDPKGAVPQALLDFDKRPLTEAVTDPSDAPALGPVSEPAAAQAPLAKSSDHANPAGDANWDWNADATWFKNIVGYKCGWHERAHMTNMLWADDWRHGWYARGYLMAASHTYGANAKAYLWQNNAWVLTNSAYIQPRHYLWWSSGDTSKRYRRYAVVGNGGNLARTHWGMRWDSQAPSDLGVICQ